MSNYRRRPSLLSEASWVEQPAPVVKPPRAVAVYKNGVHVCAGCGKGMEGKTTRAAYCEPRCRELMARYGIGVAQFDALMEARGGRCAICKRKPGRTALAVDHNHTTGQVYGLLCAVRCNLKLLGVTRDPRVYEAAAEYLTNPPAVAVIGARFAPR